jgi:hypothetical protein
MYQWLFATAIVGGALAALAAFMLGCQSWEHRRVMRRAPGAAPHADAQRVILFVPCKGKESGLRDNLQPLLEQDHGNYELAFVIESADDPARPIIEDLVADFSRRRANPRPARGPLSVRLVIAGRAASEGQKVYNLRAATARLPASAEILAFADSDARPRTDWLRRLVANLSRPGVGASTGYRWFVPARPSLANLLLYSINATAASLYGPRTLQPVWGGSWALRRPVFDRVRLQRKWKGMLTDDLSALNVIRAAGLRVMFESGCMVPAPVDATLAEMFAFLRRQYLIGRQYLPLWWAAALATTTLTALGVAAGVAATAAGLACGALTWWLPAAMVLAWYGVGVARAIIRRDLGRRYLPQYQRELAPAMRFDLWAWPLAAAVNWAAIASTALARRMTWRGVTYRLLPRGRTEVLRRDGVPQTSRRIRKFAKPLAGNLPIPKPVSAARSVF